jgi:hypothetical protein
VPLGDYPILFASRCKIPIASHFTGRSAFTGIKMRVRTKKAHAETSSHAPFIVSPYFGSVSLNLFSRFVPTKSGHETALRHRIRKKYIPLICGWQEKS